MLSDYKTISASKIRRIYLILSVVLIAFALLYPIKASISFLLLAVTVAFLAVYFFPEQIAGVSIFLLAITFQYLLNFSIPGIPSIIFLHKSVILLGVLLYIALHGVKKKVSYFPIWIYLLLSIFTFLFATRSSSYSFFDFATAFFGYILGWLIFYTDWKNIGRYLHYLVFLPMFSVVAGAVLNLVKLYPILEIDYLGSIRLEGASIAPYLAMMGMIGMVSALTLYYNEQIPNKNKYLAFALIDFAITMATVTRGAIIGALLIFCVFLYHYIMDYKKENGYLDLSRILIIAFSAVFVTAVVSYALVRTFSGSIDGTVNTSGRFVAWTSYLNQSSVNRLFDLGIGSVKTLDVTNGEGTSFTAAHNEYLRFIVETGVVGLALMILTFIVIFRKIHRNNILGRGGYLFPCLVMAFMSFSFTDNTIATPQFWLLFCWYLGLIYKNQEKRESVKNQKHFGRRGIR